VPINKKNKNETRIINAEKRSLVKWDALAKFPGFMFKILIILSSNVNNISCFGKVW